MKILVSLLVLAGIASALVGCNAGEQEAPKPDPAQFTPKSGGPNDVPKTP